ncbi:MAG TPA: PE-PPE domain-containing protein, partial [Mycobacterium sp.]|nr:PE-PPE domain-containing protein [Mycobacterium sp.]
MTVVRNRAMGAVLAAAACAAVLSTTSTFTSGMRTLLAEVGLVSNDGWIMGGTGNPIPDQDYVNSVESLYLSQYLPPNSDFSYLGLETPEQFCPIICVAGQPDLNFGDSLTQGVLRLDQAIVPDLQAGNDVSVLGYSQSAVIASIEMNNLINNTPDNVNLHDLNFTLLGDPNSPIGGILDRFQFSDGLGSGSLTPEPQHVPFLNIPLGLETTPTDTFTTDIYTGEYDGWANFPEDPSNLFADL